MLIPEHKIQEVVERVDLVGLVSRHVELKKAGRSFKGRCPFHEEKTPSFQVTPEINRYKCFGCGAGGDAISFVQRILGKTFVDAVKDLAREVGVDLEAAADPALRDRQRIKEATDFAQQFFTTQLSHPELGAEGRRYLAERGVPELVAKGFGLGWAPTAWSTLAEALGKAGLLEGGERAGLVARRQRSDGHYDTFRGRLMFPIRSPEGRPIAFGGRLLLGDQGPKYLNSRESPLYSKSDVLYGLDVAREEIRRRKSAVLVEGYFDCIGLHQVGVTNTVALCSTALTPGHLKLLMRAEARELVLLLDGDAAGQNAVERLAGILLAQGASSRVALLPQGEDPDTYAKKVGEAGVRALLDKAQPLSHHLLERVLPEGAASLFEDKMRGFDRLRPIVGQLPNGLVRSAFLSALSRHAGLPVTDLESALRGKPVLRTPVSSPAPAVAPTTKKERPPETLETAFVAALLRLPRLSATDPERTADEVSHPGLRATLAHVAGGESPQDALFEASEPVRHALEAALRQLPEAEAHLEEVFRGLVSKLRLKRIEDDLRENQRAMQQLTAPEELSEETRRLQTDRNALLELKRRVLATVGAPTPLPSPRAH
ncbi:MAG: DNA primase [Myxococcaceae bacterium]